MKKFLLSLIAVVCVAIGALGVTACVPGDLKAHNWEEKWSHSINNHWHACLDRGCNGKDQNEPHNLVLIETQIKKKPTCGKTGRGIYQCTECGVTIEDNIPATGEHDYSVSIIIDVEPSCSSNGHGTFMCRTCGDVQARDIISSSIPHNFDERVWESNKDGHYHVCQNDECNATSTLEPHTEIKDANRSIPVKTVSSGSRLTTCNDGLDVFYCSVCNMETRSVEISNPDAPVKLDVTFTNSSNQTMERTQLGDSMYEMHIKPGIYTLTFDARTASGGVVSNDRNAAWMSNYCGVRMYVKDEVNMQETWSTMDKSLAADYTGYNVNVKESCMVVFKFETGGINGDVNYRMRAAVTIKIICD